MFYYFNFNFKVPQIIISKAKEEQPGEINFYNFHVLLVLCKRLVTFYFFFVFLLGFDRNLQTHERDLNCRKSLISDQHFFARMRDLKMNTDILAQRRIDFYTIANCNILIQDVSIFMVEIYLYFDDMNK